MNLILDSVMAGFRRRQRCFVLALFIVQGVGCDSNSGDEAPLTEAPQTVIASAQVLTSERRKIPKAGDLWPNTWASNGKAYFAWGDGTGLGYCYPNEVNKVPSEPCSTFTGCTPDPPMTFCDDFCGAFACDGTTCYPPCTLTTAGVFEMTGAVADFTDCQQECNVGIHVPTGIPQYEEGVNPMTRRSDKPSSLLALGDVLYFHGHEPAGVPTRGYVAISTDWGATWTEMADSPWGSTSNFRVLMFINMGQNHSLNQDGYVYGLGIGVEVSSSQQDVHLARVPIGTVADYATYTYFTGTDSDGTPQWSSDESQSSALPNLSVSAQGGAIYHPGIKRYLFLAPSDSSYFVALYESPQPWGPWSKAQSFDGEGYIPALISKDTGPTSFYFAASGGGGVGDTYQLNINRIEMVLR